jgi:hydroxypyruvate reductase
VRRGRLECAAAFTFVEGEAREVARVAAALANGCRFDQPVETRPAWCGAANDRDAARRGLGGRNQDWRYRQAIALDGWRHVLIEALGTDGTDGPTDAAGAIATGDTVSRARVLGLVARAHLADNDAYHFFAPLGDLVITGPTGTNVNDLLFALISNDK